MRTLWQDVQYGFRMLRKSPGFTLLACLALALGIGANTALFSAVYGVLLKPLPYANGRRLVLVQQVARASANPNVNVSVHELEDYRRQSQSFNNLVEYHSMNFILLGREPDRVQTGVVSSNFFEALGVKPLMGRTFSPEDEKPGANPVLILSYSYWQKNHGGDPAIIGKAFKMNDRMHTVVGVLPPIPQYPRENDVYMPTAACPFRSNPQTIQNRSARLLRVFGELKPGVSLQQASSELDTISSRFSKEYPENYRNIKGFGVTVSSLQDVLTKQARPFLLILLATAGLVLLISCANVANLALARMTQREYEMAVRMSLGAPRARLVRQILTECTMLAVMGGLFGLLLASIGTQLLSTFMLRFTTRAHEIRLDSSVLLFTLVISVITGILFGLAPALSSSRRVSSHVQTGGRSIGLSHARVSLRSTLIVAQVCISFVLLIMAGLTLRSFAKLQSVNAGYDAENVISLGLPWNFAKYNDAAELGRFEARVLDRLRELPGVTSAASISGLPLNNATPSPQPVMIENHEQDPNAPKPEVDVTSISEGAFQSLGIALLKGRDFNRDDTTEKPGVAIISAATAHRYWGNEEAVGRRISLDQGQHWLTVVGVSGDVKFFGLDREAMDEVYVYSGQNPGTGNVVVRTTLDEQTMGDAITRAVHMLDPEQPVTDIKTLTEIREDSLVNTRVTSILLSAFAGLALVLAATGLFAVISFLVGQRTREIGIRIALGARTSSVLMMVMGEGMRMAVIGLCLGVGGALIGSGMVKSLLYGVSTTDWITFCAVGLVLVGTALLASYLPARRAAQVDPMVALRYE